MIDVPKRRGLLFIVSAPSGTGKTTLVERLVQGVPNLMMSRSYTSRPARPWENDGVDYNFVSRDRFHDMIHRGQFLEWADIFGNLYGTSASDTERLRQDGHDVVLVIDVQGARQVRSRGVATIGIFVLPPSFEILEQRLRNRSQDHDTDEQVRHRLDVARQEVDACCDYDYVVVNDDISSCVDRLRSVVIAERSRAKVVRPVTDAIIASFRTAAPSAPGRAGGGA